MAEYYENKLSKKAGEFEALFRLKEEHWEKELMKSNFELREEQLRVEHLKEALDHIHVQAEGLHRDRIEWMNGFHYLKDETQALLHDRDTCRDRLDALASMVNATIDMFRDQVIGARAWLSIATVPREVREFVELCDDKVKELRKKIRKGM